MKPQHYKLSNEYRRLIVKSKRVELHTLSPLHLRIDIEKDSISFDQPIHNRWKSIKKPIPDKSLFKPGDLDKLIKSIYNIKNLYKAPDNPVGIKLIYVEHDLVDIFFKEGFQLTIITGAEISMTFNILWYIDNDLHQQRQWNVCKRDFE